MAKLISEVAYLNSYLLTELILEHNSKLDWAVSRQLQIKVEVAVIPWIVRGILESDSAYIKRSWKKVKSP